MEGGAAEVKSVAIGELVLRPEFQVRRKLDAGTIKRYAAVMQSGQEMPPITVAVVEGVSILVDGWHRVQAMKSLGRDITLAVLVEGCDEAQVRWLAAQANLTHGLPLKSGEVREVFRAYVRAGKCWKGARGRSQSKSYREIAKDLGGLRTYGTIRTWMKKDFPRVFRRMSDSDNLFGMNGGDHPLPPIDYLGPAKEALQEALALARGVTDPRERGELIALAEVTVQALKDAAPWTPEEPADF